MSHAEDDRSLLFATLAERSGLIDRDQMDEALRRWAVDRSRLIDDLMVELGTLDRAAAAAVEAVMRAHLSGHGDDPSRSLAALSIVVHAAEGPGPRGGPDDAADPGAPTIDPDATTQAAGGGGGGGIDQPAGPRFRVIRPHARGGLGEVHVAHDGELEREVALKEIQRRFAEDAGSRARFLAEAKITGNLEHPGIVPVYGLGCHGDGRPYYAMRLVRGETLRDAIGRFHRGEGRPRSPGERAVRLRKLIVRFLAVCDAVEYAHSRGVIHRDLKPSNVLLGPYGETLIIDWGLAKPLGDVGPEEAAAAEVAGPGPDLDATVAGPATPAPMLTGGSWSGEPTRAGAAVGTPQFMAPEQARGELEALGPTSDVYGLGATLYALLTGQPPVEGGDPEAILGRVRAGEVVPARARDRSVDPSLAAICSKAMAFDPAGRYPTARALADDLERWLADEPVSARREPPTARLGRWARRHKARVAAAAAALVVGLASLGFVARARLDRERAWLDRERAIATAREAGLGVEAARRAERLQRYYALVDRLRQRAAESGPGWTWRARADVERAARLLDGGPDDPPALRTLAAGALADFDFRPAPDLDPGLNPSCLAFAPDGRTLALGEFKAQAYLSCSVALVDRQTGAVLRRLGFAPSMAFQLRVRAQDGARRIAFDPSGRWLAVGARSGLVHCWDLSRDDPGPLSWAAHEAEVFGLAFGPTEGDTPVLYTSGKDGRLRRWEIDRPGRIPAAPGAEFEAVGPVWDLAAHDSGGLACLADGRLHRLDPATLESLAEVPEVDGDRLVWGPDGRLLAAGGGRGIVLVSAEGSRVFRRLVDPAIEAAHRGGVSGLRFHPGGAVLASSSSHDDDRRVKFWDASTGALLGSVHDGGGSGYGIIDVAFDPDGGHLVATGHDRAAVLELGLHPAFDAVALDAGPVRALALSDDGRSLARLGRSGETLRAGLWDLAGEGLRSEVAVPDGGPDDAGEPAIAIAPGGDRLAFCGEGPAAYLWEPGSAGVSRTIAIPGPASVQFSEDGRRLWARCDEGKAIGCWDVDRGVRVASWSDPLAYVLRGLDAIRGLAVDGPRILAGGRDGRTRLLLIGDAGPNPAQAGGWDHGDGPVLALALRRAPDRAAVGTLGGSIVLLDLPDGGPVAEVADAHPGGVSRLAIGPDGRLLASGGLDRAVRLWRIEDAGVVPIATLGTCTGPILGLDLSRDGRSLAVAAEGEHAVRLWRLDRLAEHWSALGIGMAE